MNDRAKKLINRHLNSGSKHEDNRAVPIKCTATECIWNAPGDECTRDNIVVSPGPDNPAICVSYETET